MGTLCSLHTLFTRTKLCMTWGVCHNTQQGVPTTHCHAAPVIGDSVWCMRGHGKRNELSTCITSVTALRPGLLHAQPLQTHTVSVQRASRCYHQLAPLTLVK